jgi:hypothetical protein
LNHEKAVRNGENLGRYFLGQRVFALVEGAQALPLRSAFILLGWRFTAAEVLASKPGGGAARFRYDFRSPP